MNIKEFCMYCDYGPNGFNECKKIEESRVYVNRVHKGCKKVSIEGVQVDITEEGIKFYLGSHKPILPLDILGILKNIYLGKEMQWDVFKKPEISPLQKILGKEIYNQLNDIVKNF